MGLVLAPSYDEQTRQQIEDHLESIRSRRMAAAVEYHMGKAAKLEREADKLKAKIEKAYTQLGKRIAALEAADDAVQDALAKCEMLRSEHALIIDLSQV